MYLCEYISLFVCLFISIHLSIYLSGGRVPGLEAKEELRPDEGGPGHLNLGLGQVAGREREIDR